MAPAAWNSHFLPHYFRGAGAAELHATLDRDLHNLHLTRASKRSYIAPRSSAKSTWVTLAYVLRVALEGWEQYTAILSDSSEQANDQLRHIKSELEDNELVADVYPDAAGEGGEWKENKIRLRNGCMVAAFGTGKKIRGRRNRAERPTLVIFDDVQSNEDVRSPDLRTQTWEWATREVIPAGDERTNFLSVGSALHREAVAVRLGELAGWTGRTFPAILAWPLRMELWDRFESMAAGVAGGDKGAAARAFYDANRAEMDAGAVVYWPERFPLLELMLRRAEIGHAAFDTEYQGVPYSPEGAVFPAEWLSWDGFLVPSWPADGITKSVLYLDPSQGDEATRRGDAQAYVRAGFWPGFAHQNLIYLECVALRENVIDMVGRGVRLARDWRPDEWSYEVNATMGLLDAEVARQVREAQLLVRTWPVTHTSKEAKRVRIKSMLEPYLKRRQLRIVDSPGGRLLKSQLMDEPFAAHDDCSDAAAEAVVRLEKLLGGG